MGAQGAESYHEDGRAGDGGGQQEEEHPRTPRTPSWDADAEAWCPPEFIDPITEEVMLDPVLLLETGQTYEHSSILKWFEACRAADQECRDPLTGTVLRSLELCPNFALKRLINSWAEDHSIRDIPKFSKQHSEGLKRLASQMGKVQLSPPKPAPHGPAYPVTTNAAAPASTVSNSVGGSGRAFATGFPAAACASSGGGSGGGGSSEEGPLDAAGSAAEELSLREQPAASGLLLSPPASDGVPTIGATAIGTAATVGGGIGGVAGGTAGGTAGVAGGTAGVAGVLTGHGPSEPFQSTADHHASYPSVFGAPPPKSATELAGTAATTALSPLPPPAIAGSSSHLVPTGAPSAAAKSSSSAAEPAPPAPPLPQQQPQQSAVAPKQQQQGAAAAAAPGGGGTTSMGMYPSPGRRTTHDKLHDTEASLQALQPGQLASEAGKGAAAYHAWTLMQLASEKECKELMLRSQAIPLAVYLLGLPGLEEAKPSLAGLLQRLSVTGPAVANEILTAGGVHVLVMLVGSEDRRRRVAAANALYFMGWLGEQIRWAVSATLAQQAAQQRMPPSPINALWHFWGMMPPPPVPRPQPPPPQEWEIIPGSTDAAPPAPLPAPAPVSVPAPQVAAEDREEWETLTLLLHMLSSTAQGSSQQQLQQLASLDARGTGLPQVLAHVATSASSSDAAQYAALSTLHVLCRAVPASRGELLLHLVERLGGGDWDAAARAALVLWELLYDEGAGNSFLLLQALHAIPQFIPALLAALSTAQHHPALRKAAIGLLGCCVFDGAAFASSGTSAAAVDSKRYQIADSWRQALLSSPASPTVPALLEAAQDALADSHLSQLALTALANLAAARGTAATAGPVAPHHKPSKLDKWSAKLQDKLHGKGAAAGGGGSHPGGSHEHKHMAPGPRGAILYHDAAVPILLQLVVYPGGGFGGLEGGSGAWGSGSYAASLSPPDTPGSSTSRTSAASFAFTPVGQLGRRGSGDTQGLAPLLLPPALLALMNLVTEAVGREQVRAWAKGGHGRQQQLQACLNTAMANRQLGQQAQELARRLLHELSAVPGPLQTRMACLAVPPPPRAAAYPTP